MPTLPKIFRPVKMAQDLSNVCVCVCVCVCVRGGGGSAGKIFATMLLHS